MRNQIKKIVLKSRFMRPALKVLVKFISRYQYSPKLFSFHFCGDVNRENMSSISGLGVGNFGGKSYLLQARLGDKIETEVLRKGNWEPHILALMNVFLEHPNAVMADIGANVGASTIPLALTRQNCKFHCFEAHPYVYKKLCDNVAFNRLKNVECVNAAVSELSDTELEFFAQSVDLEDASNLGLSSLRRNVDIAKHDVIKVKGVSLDKCWQESRLDVVKIDTQGAELRVLNGMKGLLGRFRPAVFFEFEERYFDKSEAEFTRSEIIKIFTELDYELFAIHSNQSLNFYPQLNLSVPYNGDVLAMPRLVIN